MSTTAVSPTLASRFPLLTCLAGATLALAVPDILIFHGGADLIGRIVTAWAHYVQSHAEVVTWLLGLPLLGVICHALKSNTFASRAATGFLGVVTAFTMCVATGDTVGEGAVWFVLLAFVLLGPMYTGFLKLCDTDE